MNSMLQLVLLVMICLAVIGVLALRRRTLAMMAFRNISRKKRYTVLVIAGLLIATAMISGAMGVGDTLDYVIRQETYDSTGAVDIVISAKNAAGEDIYIDQNIAYDLISEIKDGNFSYLDGAQPSIRTQISVMNLATGVPYPTGVLFGVDFDNELNPLVDENGYPVGPADLTNGNIVINRALADEIDADVGDTLAIVTSTGLPQMLVVSQIAADSGAGRWQNSKLAFVDLTLAQNSLVYEPQMINKIDISNLGTTQSGYKVTDQAIAELEEYLPDGIVFEFSTIKKDGIDAAQQASDQVTQIFVVMSSFAIIAGVALIINIFVMLAEERKPEMGVSRAIGMQRGDLTQSFLFEGVVYAILASIVGAFAGLLIAAVMMSLFTVVFGGGLAFALHFKSESLVISACAGFLLTLLTVAVASWRVSKLNIVRAIRDIPEPILAKSETKYIAFGIAGVAFGIIMTFIGASADQAAGIDAGPALVALGASMVLLRFVGPRIPFTLTGLFMVWWTLDPTDLKGQIFGDVPGNIEMFIVTGVLLVTGGVIIVIFNSDLMLEGLTRIFNKRKSMLPVFKAAVSYPMNKRFRTGLTLFIFALIMFTVTVISMIASFQRESVDATAQQFSGGFEIMGMSIRDIPANELTTGISNLTADGVVDRVEQAVSAPISLLKEGSSESTSYSMIGFSQSMLEDNKFSLAKRSEAYRSDEDVWRALVIDPTLVILDGTVQGNMFGPSFGTLRLAVGERFTIIMGNGAMTNVTVIGLTDQTMNMAVFTSRDFVLSHSPVARENMLFISTAPGSEMTDKDVAKQLEITFVDYGLMTFVVRDTIKSLMTLVSSIMQLMEIFLGMGLVVGISGLGIITIRNVAERRQEIGVMRAIGYQRTMVLNTFLLETSFVALLGIVLGVIFGLALSYRLWDFGGFSKYSPFVIPWGEILFVVLVAFVITLVSTLPPSRRAARLAPAEALRRVD